MAIVGVDTGGTFSDLVLFDGRSVRVAKVLSMPDDPSRAVLQGLRELGALDAEVVHGSTVATNAFLERKGAPVTLLTNAGFEDVLEIGRQARGSLYDLGWVRPEPLVPAGRRSPSGPRRGVRRQRHDLDSERLDRAGAGAGRAATGS